jgi:PASTA domain
MPDAPTAGGKIKIPGFGEVNKKTAALVGGLVVIGGVLWWRHEAATSAAANTAAAANSGSSATGVQMVTDPAGNQCAEVDDATGYCPGTTEDEQALEQSSSSDLGGLGDTGVAEDGGYSPYPTAGNEESCPDGSAPSGYDDFGNPICSEGGAANPGTTTTPITTNDQWVQEVDTLFPSYTQAVAMVLGGVTVSTAQKNQFLEAVGVFGQPPEGYPTPIKTSDTSGQPGKTTQLTVPNVVGQDGTQAKLSLVTKGFKVAQNPATTPKGKTTKVTSQNPRAGQRAAKGSTVTIGLAVNK